MNDAELLRVRRLLDGTNPVPERVVEGSDARAAGRQALARIIATAPDPSSARIILDHVSSRDATEKVLANSYHVATLDNDAPEIFEQSADFVARVTAP